ncbi:DUF5318 family protein [Corynebacterium uberis]|uniref:DUF5318 family protein n=1 Tax=Corynebacterium TaxID=1716 RepID=UPI001D0B5203|nr:MULTISPECIES: DUF5318 family protein [Corynebacterium]MCZ9310331.1 DUF5318 domain-containing protein [Corynebacterium sp. c6VSa_13]UDL73359.1 DUF5318 domain-containing protein [Corynebacterium uberis]UDL75763.1 DUF5318 domain-containing protein [Corynebacterium uberis]UDL77975.1 DUF5318 domain-containing protein [Corynebacterium uberis]UDL80258.1 DUF5318 domain-containing protein [Corynebacterium uberis]
MIVYSQEVSHELRRRDLLRRYRAGQVSREEVCDAEFILVAASDFHGSPAPRPCPVCGSQRLRWMRWIHGDALGKRSGSARTEEEIATIVATRGPLTVHRVEVCPDCRWNFLLSSATASIAAAE